MWYTISRLEIGENWLVGMETEEILHEAELARRLGTTISQVRKWEQEGKFSPKVVISRRGDLVYTKYLETDTVNSHRIVDRILDEMEDSRLNLL